MMSSSARLAVCALAVLACAVDGRGTGPPGLQRRSTPSETPQALRAPSLVRRVRGGGKASSRSASVFNLVNNVAGAGILTLPAGMGAGTGLVPALVLTAILGLVSAHTFERIGEAAELTGEMTFKGIWSRSLGEETSWIVDAAIYFMCLSAAIIYAGIMGDVLTSILELMGVPSAYNSRSMNIVGLAALVLLPLSLLRDLSGLAFTSLLGFAAVVYTVIFMVIRAADGTYATGGAWASKLSASQQPNFTDLDLFTLGPKALVLVNNLGLAFIAHYNAPVFYRELEGRSVPRFSGVVRGSFLIITSLYAVTMASGFFTFGRSTASNILNSYHGSDPLAVVGRIATGLSVLFGFPLAFVGLKESCASLGPLLPAPARALASRHDPLVVVMLALVTLVACLARDIGLLVGISGAVLGSMIVYVFPALIWVKVAEKHRPAQAQAARRANLPLVPLGAFVGALGVYMSLKNAGII